MKSGLLDPPKIGPQARANAPILLKMPMVPPFSCSGERFEINVVKLGTTIAEAKKEFNRLSNMKKNNALTKF